MNARLLTLCFLGIAAAELSCGGDSATSGPADAGPDAVVSAEGGGGDPPDGSMTQDGDEGDARADAPASTDGSPGIDSGDEDATDGATPRDGSPLGDAGDTLDARDGSDGPPGDAGQSDGASDASDSAAKADAGDATDSGAASDASDPSDSSAPTDAGWDGDGALTSSRVDAIRACMDVRWGPAATRAAVDVASDFDACTTPAENTGAAGDSNFAQVIQGWAEPDPADRSRMRRVGPRDP